MRIIANYGVIPKFSREHVKETLINSALPS